MDLAKLDNWEDALRKIKRLLDDDLYDELDEAIDLRKFTKLIKVIDKRIEEKMEILERANGLGHLSEDDQVLLQKADQRIGQRKQIFDTLVERSTKELESDLDKAENDEEADLIEQVIDILIEEWADYTFDYEAIRRYNSSFTLQDEVEDVQNLIERYSITGFKAGGLTEVLEKAYEHIEAVEEAIEEWDQHMETPSTGGRRGAVVLPDLEDIYNSNLPGNSHGVRSVTTLLKAFRQILNKLRKANLDNEDGYGLLEMPFIDSYRDFLRYNKLASKFIKVLTPWANPSGKIKASDYDLGLADMDMRNDLVKRVAKVRRLMDLIQDKMPEAL
ncbi:MAG: hypothetical protein AAF502_16160 [Bacteroidota bacterium]